MKEKPGDVSKDGIVIKADDGKIMYAKEGIVIIHASRLRRARRMGWSVYEPTTIRVDPGNVAVKK